MNLNYECLNKLCEKYGNAFYLLDSEQFVKNYNELKSAFSEIYPQFNIAYSYKTNYTPKFCKIIDSLGGFAEVVSDMELEIALKIGVSPKHIIWNGPYKNPVKFRELLLAGGTVNLDSWYDLSVIKEIVKSETKAPLNVGIRCNADIGDGVLSRFGFDVCSDEFKNAIEFLKSTPNINLVNIQCHFACRRLDTWRPRAEMMLDLLDKFDIAPERIDIGGGLYGKMSDDLKAQFDAYIPEYREYAESAATLFAERFADSAYKPLLLIEPGTALVGDCMKFVSRVTDIKSVRGHAIATLLGSMYNINPTLNKKNPPISVYHGENPTQNYSDIDLAGYTCIESDYLYRGFNGDLAVGDLVVFDNVGSYSVVLKPPFILPNFPILDICGDKTVVEKRGEVFEDLFHTFNFHENDES